MSSLSDHIDRLSRQSKSIKLAASKTAVPHKHNGLGGPFTRAVLGTPLGDLIRDIDPSELGLFVINDPSIAASPHDQGSGLPSTAEITRVEFSGATPLRKPRKEDGNKARELDPEVYAQAAAKYLDRYEQIRPMPRAHAQVESILESISAVRENIGVLSKTLNQANLALDNSSTHSATDLEDDINELQARITELKKRKAAALEKKTKPRRNIPRSDLSPKAKTPPRPPPIPDPAEDQFWNTPAPARTFHFTENLLDEHVDLGDVSAFASPIPPLARSGKDTGTRFSLRHGFDDLGDSPKPAAQNRASELDETIFDVDETGVPPLEEGDKVVPEEVEPDTPSSQPPSSPLSEPDAPQRHGKTDRRVKVNIEVERITERIWMTVGDLIVPGNSYSSASGAPPDCKSPRAKETIMILQALASQTPEPDSPSFSSQASYAKPQTTPQQILTAHLLLVLLAAPPSYSLSLNRVKELLSTKAGRAMGTGASTTRVVYSGVAKRLLKIDRGGGEQVVRFDLGA